MASHTEKKGPIFNNIRPRSRKERLALCDKASREKELLLKRPGHAAKLYRENVPDTPAGLTSLGPDGAGYITDADRFHTDVSGEEYQRRKALHERQLSIIEKKRRENAERERQKWERVDRERSGADSFWKDQRQGGLKARANESMVPYNTITLRYNDGLDGDRLRYQDDRQRFRATLRARHIHLHGGCKYNLLSGEDITPPHLPPEPKPSPALKDWLATQPTTHSA